MSPTARPLSVRNRLCLVRRVLRDETPWMAGTVDRERLLELYRQRVPDPPGTPTGRRAHARWLGSLLDPPSPRVTPADLHRPASLGWRPGPGPASPSVGRKHAFDVAEVERLHAAARAAGPESEVLLLLLFTTGLRVGGLSRLPLPRAADQDTLVTEEKGGRRLPVVLAPCVWDALRRWWAVRPPRAPAQTFLFASRYDPGRPASTSHLSRCFGRLCAAARVTGRHAHIHTTRHTVAVALRLAGCRIIDIAAFLGHAHPATTLRVYSTPSFEQLLGTMRLPWYTETTTTAPGREDDRLLRALAPQSHGGGGGRPSPSSSSRTSASS